MNKHSEYALSLINEFTLEEKIALVSGHNFMYTNAIPRLNIPSIRMSDGPHGLRVQNEGSSGVMGNYQATSFPTAATTSNSFDPSLLERMGSAIGKEARYYGINVVLGPGVNIKRNPLCGRNFEYFSEDPFLSSRLGASEICGIQKEKVASCVKHFAFNNEENHRFMGDSIVDMRAAYEIYLKSFEYIIKNAHPECVMNAYNKINGVYCSENKWLLKNVLRDEWGYNGLVMTDWGANHDRIKGIKSGCDLEMPGDATICRKWIYDAINSGELDINDLNECVLNVLDLVSRHRNTEKIDEIDWENHHSLSKIIAEESAVLLKNDGALPLNGKEKICVIGELFEKMRYQGSGSSMINPSFLFSSKDAFDKNNIDYKYFKGYEENSYNPSKSLINEALEGSKDFDKVLLFLGLTDYEESEGGDRNNMSLPSNQLSLVEELIKANKKIVVVLFGGSIISLPFYDNVCGILNMFLPGQNGGEATYDLLFGKANPSGKLSETWPIKYEDVPFYDEFGKHKIYAYKESIFVGYRYYLTKGINVRFPFGYGLSYTNYEYSNLIVTKENNYINVKVDVKNSGVIDGKEIVEVYVKGPETNFFKPLRELKGFTKVFIKANETKEIKISIPLSDLSFYNIQNNKFELEDGEFEIQIGKNSRDILLRDKIYIDGVNLDNVYDSEIVNIYKELVFNNYKDDIFEKMSNLTIPKEPSIKPITLESKFSELKETLFGKIFYKAVINVALKDLKQAKKLPEGIERDNRIKAALSLKLMLENNSIISLSMSGGKGFPYNYAEGFRDFSNGHVIKGIKDFTKKIKAPNLPCEEK